MTVHPLLVGGRLVLVDNHPICRCCGHSAVLADTGGWRHGRPTGTAARAGWPEAITLEKLRALSGYPEFAARFPWAVGPRAAEPQAVEPQADEPRADGMPGCTAEDLAAAVHRLNRYTDGLAAAQRGQSLHSGGNPLLDLFEELTPPGGRLSPGLAALLDLATRRRELVDAFSWAIPTEEALSTVARYAPIVEGGAGTGYWTALLTARGVDAVGYDLAPAAGPDRNEYHPGAGRQWTKVGRAATLDAVRRHRDRTLLLCWPPNDDDAASYLPLRAYTGDVLLYVGGGTGSGAGEVAGRPGASGSVRFGRELALNWSPAESVPLPGWPGVPDRLVVHRRNPVRRALRERDRCHECGRYLPSGAIGRCDRCFRRNPPALALRVAGHRVEYNRRLLDRMPSALVKAFEASPNRITCPGAGAPVGAGPGSPAVGDLGPCIPPDRRP